MNAGVCDHCWAVAPARIITATVASNSGPPRTYWGCIPCARALADSPQAPTWLRYRLAELDKTPPGRCRARHQDDPTPCEGARAAVTVTDRTGARETGCVPHAARMAAGVDGATLSPGPEHEEGDSIRAHKLAQQTRGKTA